jgi:hypothetical protein
MDTTPDGLLRLNAELRSQAQAMLPLWEECGRMTVTRKVQSLIRSSTRSASLPGGDFFSPQDMRLLNTSAANSNRLLSGGIMSWAFPADQPWYAYKPQPQQTGIDALETWLAHCSEIAHFYLSASNFYSRTHERTIDDCTFGTGAMTAEAGRRGPLNFKTYDAGSYVVHEDADGMVDMVFRERSFSALQARDEFGGDALPATVQQDLQANKGTNRHIFLHCVYQRELKDVRPDKGPTGMPVASVWIHMQSKQVVRTRGFDSMPNVVTRHLRWSEDSPYGVSPAMEALGAIRGVNYMEMLMTMLGEVSVTPRILMPQGAPGPPDLRAGGITMKGLTSDSSPQEWAAAGRFDIGLKLIERMELAIGEMFHRPLFAMLSDRTGDLNIPHVRALEFERLSRFSPAFTQLTTEFTNPILERVFMLLFNAGKFPPPPQEALVRDAAGNLVMLYPQVVQTSRLAMAMQAARRMAVANALEIAIPLEASGHRVLDNFDSDAAFIDILRGGGAPNTFIRESDVRDQIRQKREDAQRAAEHSQMLQEAMKSKPLVEAGLGAMAA